MSLSWALSTVNTLKFDFLKKVPWCITAQQPDMASFYIFQKLTISIDSLPIYYNQMIILNHK